jgi:hypothetical protein
MIQLRKSSYFMATTNLLFTSKKSIYIDHCLISTRSVTVRLQLIRSVTLKIRIVDLFP